MRRNRSGLRANYFSNIRENLRESENEFLDGNNRASLHTAESVLIDVEDLIRDLRELAS